MSYFLACTLTHTQALTPLHALSHTLSFTHSLTGTHSPARTHSYTLSHTHAGTHSPSLTRVCACVSGSSSSGFSGSGFKAAAPAGTSKSSNQSWQQQQQAVSQPTNKPWVPPNSAPKPSTTQSAKPNYNLNFSVIGGREERGRRGPGFGKQYLSDTHTQRSVHL